MNYQKRLRQIRQSSIVIDENPLFWLIKERILIFIWETLHDIARSVEIANETFERALREIGTLLQKEKPSLFDEMFFSELQQVNRWVKQNKILRSVTLKFEETTRWCFELEIKNPERKIVEPIALIALLSEIKGHIFLVTDNPVLKEVLFQLVMRGYIKSEIYFCSTYHFALLFYTRCCIKINEFLEFKRNYFRNPPRKDNITQKWWEKMKNRALEETPSATHLKNSIGVLNKIIRSADTCPNDVMTILGNLNHQDLIKDIESALYRNNISFTRLHRHVTGEEWGCDFILESRVGLQIKSQKELKNNLLTSLYKQYGKARIRLSPPLHTYVIAFAADIEDSNIKSKSNGSRRKLTWGQWRHDRIMDIQTECCSAQNPEVKIIGPRVLASFLHEELQLKVVSSQ